MHDWHTSSTFLRELTDAGNHAAWERLHHRFRGPILRFARRLGLTETDAEDVAQETLMAFAAAYQTGRFEQSKGRLSHWLFGIAYRQTRRAIRDAARRARLAAHPERTAFWSAVPDETKATRLWDVAWERALLEECLQRVRAEVEPLTMRAFELVVRGERNPADVADELGVPVKCIYNAKYAVLRRVRDWRAAFEIAP